MSDQRRPATFRLDDPAVAVSEVGHRVQAPVQIVPEAEPADLPAIVEPIPVRRRGLRWGAIFFSTLGALVSLAVGLSVTRLIEDLFARNATLGYVGLGLAAVCALAFLIVAGREIAGLARLNRIDRFHTRAEAVLANDDRTAAQGIVRDLLSFAQASPRLARPRAILAGHIDDIIDGADLIRLAERELMAPLDEDAKRLISSAAQRVSIVTAASPRAVVDILFVAATGLRLVRQLAVLYGGRPGALGTARLVRLSIAHLAVTGGMAATDSLIEQIVGHGLAAKLSAKLGEGMLNGLMTARLGLATMDVCRPLPFNALPRPALGDLVKGLLKRPGETGST